MIFDLIGSAVKVVDDVATVALAPVKIAADVAVAVTEPVAEVVSDLAKDISSALGQDDR